MSTPSSFITQFFRMRTIERANVISSAIDDCPDYDSPAHEQDLAATLSGLSLTRGSDIDSAAAPGDWNPHVPLGYGGSRPAMSYGAGGGYQTHMNGSAPFKSRNRTWRADGTHIANAGSSSTSTSTNTVTSNTNSAANSSQPVIYGNGRSNKWVRPGLATGATASSDIYTSNPNSFNTLNSNSNSNTIANHTRTPSAASASTTGSASGAFSPSSSPTSKQTSPSTSPPTSPPKPLISSSFAHPPSSNSNSNSNRNSKKHHPTKNMQKFTPKAPSAPFANANRNGNAPGTGKGKPISDEKKKHFEDLKYGLVTTAALATMRLLQENDIGCAIFGGLACRVYGSPRCPKDVDFLVLPPASSPYTSDTLIKNLLVSLAPAHFFLKPPLDPAAPYSLLFYRRTANLSPGAPNAHHHICKVDLVLPPALLLPRLPAARAVWTEGMPLVPYALLLLQKLQGWDDHLASGEEWKRKKAEEVDAEDVRLLLRLPPGVKLREARGWMEDAEVFTDGGKGEFVRKSRERVDRFVEVYPETRVAWRALGFEV